MTVLLTGASGFLGSHIAEQLSRAGRQVRALVRKSSDTRALERLAGVELVQGAVDDRDSLERAVSGATHVIHAAGVVKAKSPADFHFVNTGGTVNLLDAVRTQAPDLTRFVLVSSLAVVGPSTDGSPVDGDRKPAPVTDYGRSKLGAERAARAVQDDVPVTIIRPPAIYGPRDREVLALFKAVQYGVMPVMGSTQRGMSVVFGPDCAAACIAALDAPTQSGNAYFVEDGHTRTLGELAQVLESVLGKRAWFRFPIPRLALEAAAAGSELFGALSGRAVMLTRDKCNELYAPHWVCDGSETRRDLGWEPKVPFDRGARITAEWYRREGWL
jgi:nucleoside-diphosphate-sugar epimerase